MQEEAHEPTELTILPLGKAEGGLSTWPVIAPAAAVAAPEVSQ